jgi:hypothetical protein
MTRLCQACLNPSCDGRRCYLETPEPEAEEGKTLEQLIAENPELRAYRDKLRAELWGMDAVRGDPMRRVA